MKPFTHFKLNALIDLFLKSFLLVITISVFVPFSPKMPAPGLDPSWALGLNQALALGLAFGKDIVFTLGPYSAIYTKAYHPSTDLMMMSGSFYLAVSYWMCFLYLMRGIKWHWTLLFCGLLLTMIYVRDSLLFSYPLLVGLACFKMNACEKPTGLAHRFYLVLFFAPFGLLPLIKGSLLILCALVAALCAGYFLINKKNQSALLCLLSPLVSLVLFWLVAGQSVNNLLPYMSSTISLASSFTEAMSVDGIHDEIILYLVNSVLIFLFIVFRKQLPATARLFILGIFFIFLFLSFKTGFTRHYGHAFIASSSILIAALMLPFMFNSKLTLLLILFSLNTWSYINSHYTPISIANNFKSTYTAAWFGLKHRINDPNSFRKDFELAMNFLQQRSSFPSLLGTTDIYSSNQSYLIASPNTWSPRPVFQSYSVFTANLAEKNRRHLLGNNRPDNIIFRIEPIDERIPSLEDGSSWPLLIANYQPVEFKNGFLFLQKRNPITENSTQLLVSETHFLGETIELPKTTHPLFAQIEIKPTWGGYLAILFFKPAPLQISFELQNGIKKQYRFIRNMAKSGFLLSPLIENTAEFALLYNQASELDTKAVKSFQISLDQSQSWQWNHEYIVHFKTLN
ncbi:MAG: hypothetical protein CK430_08875 [Legionella sp.]|nr:MAG: hypothetical protein CK430_08875 [Legionella sp.]